MRGSRDVWGSLVQDMGDTRSEPASEGDKNGLNAALLPVSKALASNFSVPTHCGWTTSAPAPGLDHVVCFGQWGASRLGDAGMNVPMCFCPHLWTWSSAKEMSDQGGSMLPQEEDKTRGVQPPPSCP